jgi:DUF1009 family protein
MDDFIALDSLEVLVETWRRQLLTEKDAVTIASLKASLERAERVILQGPVQKRLKLTNIAVEQLYGKGSMGLVWRVSFRI